MQRGVLTLAAVIFVARGLLVVPYALAGQQEWRTPIGRFVVNGQWFAPGSMVVLVIGILISIGVFQSRRNDVTSQRRCIRKSVRGPVTGERHLNDD